MLLFITTLLVAGGIIAYVGDRLGTYIGKKRLSAWGLRPRHTAMLYTVVSGGLIAVLTLFALIGYDRAVQRALLYGPEILRQNEVLAQEDHAQRLLIQREDARAQAASSRAQAALQQAGDAEHRLATALGRLIAARGGLQKSQRALLRRKTQLAAARRQFAAVNAGLTETRLALGAARSRLGEAERAYQDAHRNVQVARAQYDTALGTVGALARTANALTRQGQALAARNADLTQQNAALDAKNQQLLNQTTFLQGAHLIYHKGQEVGRAVIPTGLAVPDIRQRILAFLGQLSARAEREGATQGDNGRAVRVVADSPDVSVSEGDAVDALAQSIAAEARAAPGVVVVAVAHYNAFGGEQTPVKLQPYDNVLVYSQGEFIADTAIDGSLPENQILNALRDFLTGRVQPDARSRGIIPRPDPETGEPTVGEPTDDAQTYALVKHIQQIGPGALVTARAAQDTYSSGPLRLLLTASPGVAAPAPLPPPARPLPPPTAAGITRPGGRR